MTFKNIYSNFILKGRLKRFLMISPSKWPSLKEIKQHELSSRVVQDTEYQEYDSPTKSRSKFDAESEIHQLKQMVKSLQQNNPENNPKSTVPLEQHVKALQDAFSTLSEVVVDEIDALRTEMVEKWTDYENKYDQQQKVVAKLKTQMIHLANHVDHERATLRDTVGSLSKVETRSEETRIDMTALKCQVETLLNRDRQITRRLEDISSNSDQATEWIHRLKAESSQMRQFMHTMKEDYKTCTKSIVTDIESLGDTSTRLRTLMNQQQATVVDKIAGIQETVDLQHQQDQVANNKMTKVLSDKVNQAVEQLRTSMAHAQREFEQIRTQSEHDRQQIEATVAGLRRKVG